MKYGLLFLSALMSFTVVAQPTRVGLLVVATGKYIQFVEPLISSAEQYFCPGCEVTYFIFTEGDVTVHPRVVKIAHQKLGWPYDTLMRSSVYAKSYEAWKSMDYVFACDADMLFVDTVGNEILHDLVGTQHPGFVNQRGSYETNPRSKACVKNNEGTYYFAGGFYGGKTKEFFKLVSRVTRAIESDLQKRYIAVWHDESHLNRYFIDHKPTKVLSPSYCYPGPGYLYTLPDCPAKLIAITKDHAAVRK